MTGGAGFIGSNYLNFAVPKYPSELFINVDLLTYAADIRNVSVANHANYIFEKADIGDFAVMQNIFEKYKPTHVLHFAAETHVDLSISNPSVCIHTNVDGTNTLLQLARDHHIHRFHLISTDEVYGELKKDDPSFTEQSPYRPRNPYSASKAGAELLLFSYMRTYSMPGIITRSSNNYGPHQDETKLIPKFITYLLNNKKVPLYALGENIRDWLYVEENVRAIDLVFRQGVPGEAYNIGGDQEYSNLEVTRQILKLLNKSEAYIEFVTDRAGHDFRYSLSNSKIKKLGWKPKVRFAEGIKKTVAFYKKKHHDNTTRN